MKFFPLGKTWPGQRPATWAEREGGQKGRRGRSRVLRVPLTGGVTVRGGTARSRTEWSDEGCRCRTLIGEQRRQRDTAVRTGGRQGKSTDRRAVHAFEIRPDRAVHGALLPVRGADGGGDPHPGGGPSAVPGPQRRKAGEAAPRLGSRQLGQVRCLLIPQLQVIGRGFRGGTNRDGEDDGRSAHTRSCRDDRATAGVVAGLEGGAGAVPWESEITVVVSGAVSVIVWGAAEKPIPPVLPAPPVPPRRKVFRAPGNGVPMNIDSSHLRTPDDRPPGLGPQLTLAEGLQPEHDAVFHDRFRLLDGPRLPDRFRLSDRLRSRLVHRTRCAPTRSCRGRPDDRGCCWDSAS